MYLNFHKLFIAIGAGFFLLQSCVSQAQNLHVFSVVESNDFNRADRLVDLDRVDKTAQRISQYVGLDQYYYNFGTNNAFSVAAIRSSLARLGKVSCSSDVIWFHFSGYGRNDGQSVWPVLKLTDGEIPLSEIVTILQQKRPKLLLITVEAGNKRADSKELSNQAGEEPDEAETYKQRNLKRSAISPKISTPVMLKIPHFSTIENYERLFKQYDGQKIVILGSCSVGQNSISNSTGGSEWLNRFSKVFEQMTGEQTLPVSWESINRQISTEIQDKFKGKQKPQASIKTISSDCETPNENAHE